jgi:hypothetical protein
MARISGTHGLWLGALLLLSSTFSAMVRLNNIFDAILNLISSQLIDTVAPHPPWARHIGGPTTSSDRPY